MDGGNGSGIDLLHCRWRTSDLQKAEEVILTQIVIGYLNFVDDDIEQLRAWML